MANQRIAYGLCKKYGIKLKEGATPADAWKALKEAGHGDEVEKETSNGSSEEVSKYVNNSRDKLYSQLTSAYQEDAIDDAEGDTKEEFIKSAVENYRDKIKSLGISTEKGFKRYGDDTHVANIAGKIFDNEHMSKNSEASNPRKLSEKMNDSNDRLTSTYENAKSKGQTPQQVLDTVSYDLDIKPGSDEFKKLKEMIKKDIKLVNGEYKFEQQSASNPKKLSEKMNVDNEEEYERNKKQFKDFIVKHENYKSMVSAIKTQQGLMNKLNKQGFLNSADNKKWYDTTKKIADLTHKIEKDYEDKIGMNSFMSASAIAEYELMKGK